MKAAVTEISANLLPTPHTHTPPRIPLFCDLRKQGVGNTQEGSDPGGLTPFMTSFNFKQENLKLTLESLGSVWSWARIRVVCSLQIIPVESQNMPNILRINLRSKTCPRTNPCLTEVISPTSWRALLATAIIWESSSKKRVQAWESPGCTSCLLRL